jgi:hypothetical protein
MMFVSSCFVSLFFSKLNTGGNIVAWTALINSSHDRKLFHKNEEIESEDLDDESSALFFIPSPFKIIEKELTVASYKSENIASKILPYLLLFKLNET